MDGVRMFKLCNNCRRWRRETAAKRVKKNADTIGSLQSYICKLERVISEQAQALEEANNKITRMTLEEVATV